MDLMTDPIVEMEEWLSQDVPCGGNNFPVPMSCPDNAAAEWVNRHCLSCMGTGKFLKCNRCYITWYEAVVDGAPRCKCGLMQMPQHWYTPL